MADLARAMTPPTARNVLTASDRLIVALDVPTVQTAREIVNRLGTDVSHYKIGPHLQFARGMAEFAAELVSVQRKHLFLDFKSVDIGDTIEIAVNAAKDIGVKFITIFGASSVINAAVRARGNSNLPKVLVITLLTDHSEADMRAEFDTKDTLTEFVEKRTKMVIDAGGDGVIVLQKRCRKLGRLGARFFDRYSRD
jgi:orotidine-5'-phosphate decarboxylase